MVDCDSILLSAFVVLCLPPNYYTRSGSQEASCTQAVEDLQTSNYFVSLPPCADWNWKLIGWDKSYVVKRSNRVTKIANSIA